VSHVKRGADLAAAFLKEKEYSRDDVGTVRNLIQCTGLDAAMGVISFQDKLERAVGLAVGTADLLGQMAAEDYVEKLPVLYAEFAEAARYSKDRTHFVAMYSSAEDLMRKTPDFWEKFVQVKLDRDFGGLHRFLNDPYPKGPNEYLDRIEANMERLRRKFPVVAR
jgi:hypothetical protein